MANETADNGESRLEPASFWADQAALHHDDEDEDADSALGADGASSTTSLASSILKYRTVHGRTYHSDHNNNNYWGANDEKQNNLLDILHHALTLSLDGKLHLAPLPDKVQRVLDVGTGTGIWAIDFSDEHPEAAVIGTDLSPIQPVWIPPNLSFQIDDFTEPWTFEDNSFDFIHLRWLSGAVADWTELFRKAYKALKPGGWIESFDIDAGYKSDDGSITKAVVQTDHIFREGVRKVGLKNSINVVSDKLQRPALEANGFVNIKDTKIKLPLSEWPADAKGKEIGAFVRLALKTDLEGSINFMATQLGWTQDDIRVFCACFHRDLRNMNVHAYCLLQLSYAQKPLDA